MKEIVHRYGLGAKNRENTLRWPKRLFRWPVGDS